jgi:hypothetical protein
MNDETQNNPPEAPQVPQPDSQSDPSLEPRTDPQPAEELPSDGEQVRDGVEEAPNA